MLDLTAYRQEVELYEREAAKSLDSTLKAYFKEMPNATVDEARAYTNEAMRLQLGIWGEAASARSIEMFEAVCEAEGIPAVAERFDIIDFDRVREAIHYAGHHHLEQLQGDIKGYRKRCRYLIGSYVHREAFDQIIKNCEANKIKWARVPTGLETCAYCLMLASRGFEYRSNDTARAGCHDGCDCLIVPGTDSTSIAGYNPKAMEDSYKALCKELGISSNTMPSSKEFRKLNKLMELKDPEWVYHGKVPEVDYSEMSRSFLESDKNHKKDIFAHDALAAHGVKPKILKELTRPEWNGPNIDTVVRSATSGNPLFVEIKSPEGNSKRLIENAIREAKDQFSGAIEHNDQRGDASETRVVINLKSARTPLPENMRTADKTMEEVERQQKAHQVRVVTVVFEDGSIRTSIA